MLTITLKLIIDICPIRSIIESVKEIYLWMRGDNEYIMARPRKGRKVCCLPENKHFGPLDAKININQFVVMAVDEYEVIRLIDLEGLTQEECANQMHIARTTVQRTYSDARKKVAESLVCGKALKIEGGDYELCNDYGQLCGSGNCRRHRFGRGQNKKQKGEL